MLLFLRTPPAQTDTHETLPTAVLEILKKICRQDVPRLLTYPKSGDRRPSPTLWDEKCQHCEACHKEQE